MADFHFGDVAIVAVEVTAVEIVMTSTIQPSNPSRAFSHRSKNFTATSFDEGGVHDELKTYLYLARSGGSGLAMVTTVTISVR